LRYTPKLQRDSEPRQGAASGTNGAAEPEAVSPDSTRASRTAPDPVDGSAGRPSGTGRRVAGVVRSSAASTWSNSVDSSGTQRSRSSKGAAREGAGRSPRSAKPSASGRHRFSAWPSCARSSWASAVGPAVARASTQAGRTRSSPAERQPSRPPPAQ